MKTGDKNPRVLIVEDDESLAKTLEMVLSSEGYEVACLADGAEGLEHALDGDWDVVLTDFRLPGLGGMELLEKLAEAKPNLPAVMMTSHGTSDTAIGATRRGAFDYLLKPFDTDEMLAVLAKAVRSSRSMSRPVALGAEPSATGGGAAMIGGGRAMREVYKEIGLVAETRATVLIRGETGTGKELVARAIYKHSERADGPFIAVNCGAIPENLLESELFGHVKGAFTGADMRRIGRFEQADGGTLFLDEIGDMPAATQVKILRVLQERTIRPLGGSEEIPVDVRVIAATHQNLERLIAAGDFREDLFYRLNTVTITIPPLRERPEDIAALVKYFVAHSSAEMGVPAAKLGAKPMAMLGAHDWPGNVRQLENVVTKLVLQSRGRAVEPSQVDALLGDAVSTGPEVEVGSADARVLSVLRERRAALAAGDDGPGAYTILVEELEQKLLRAALGLCGGNQSEASRILGVSRVTLKQKMTKFGIAAKGD